MSLEGYTAAAAILLAAYFIRGISGFGSGLIAVPLLALWLPLQFVVPLLLLLDFSASLLLGGVNFRQVDWREIRVLLPFSLIGVITGTALLLHLPLKPTLVVLALFVGAFGVRSLLNLHGDRLISRGWAIPAALTGGAVGALFGTGGPPYVIYLTHRIHDKGRLRASFSGLFFIEGLLRITSFAVVERALQRGQQVLGAGFGVGGDLAANLDQRGVRAGRHRVVVAHGEGRVRHRHHQQQPRQADESWKMEHSRLFFSPLWTCVRAN